MAKDTGANTGSPIVADPPYEMPTIQWDDSNKIGRASCRERVYVLV